MTEPIERVRVFVSQPHPTGPGRYALWALLWEADSLNALHERVARDFTGVSWAGPYEGWVEYPVEMDSSLRHRGRAGDPSPPT